MDTQIEVLNEYFIDRSLPFIQIAGTDIFEFRFLFVKFDCFQKHVLVIDYDFRCGEDGTELGWND